MILFDIKNLIVGSFSSLGITVISPTNINSDALPYIFYVTNLTENGDNIQMGRNQNSTLTFDIMCTAKEADKVQSAIQKAYDYMMSQQFVLDAKDICTISTATNYQNQDDYDPTSGLNTVVLSMRLNYITIKR